MKSAVIPHIVEQHSEESSFLWILRSAAVWAPHFGLKDLVRLDNRVEAHLDGLRVAGETGWELCTAALQLREPGEVFAAAVLALEGGDAERIRQVYEAVLAAPETFRGLVSAIGWASPASLQGTVQRLLTSESAFWRGIGIRACAVHRVDPGAHLALAVQDEDATLRAHALRTAGELGRRDMINALEKSLHAEDPACRFWAAWSSVLLGERGEALELLRASVASGSAFRERALQLALRAMDPEEARNWLKGLAQYPDWGREVVVGAGIAADPAYVPWLIKQMEVPELARVAGEAFTMIAGADLPGEDLEGKRPEAFRSGPTESPEDEEVAMDLDEDLPWPAPGLVQRWWERNRQRFQSGTRYLAGKPVGADHCREILLNGRQRQRIAAALELSLLQPGRPLFETRAPGFRQLRGLVAAR